MNKKRNAIKILLITLGVLLFIIAGTVTAGYFALNKMFSMVSESFTTTLTEELQNSTEEQGKEATDSPSAPLPEAPATQTQTPVEKPPTKTPTTNAPMQKEEPKETEVHMKLPLHNVSLSEALFKTLTEEIPFSDKLAVFNILTSGLSTSDMKRIVAMIQGGITNEEVREAYGILSRGLSDENKKKILQYYYKHIGLIQ